MFYQAAMAFWNVVGRFHRMVETEQQWQNPAWAV